MPSPAAVMPAGRRIGVFALTGSALGALLGGAGSTLGVVFVIAGAVGLGLTVIKPALGPIALMAVSFVHTQSLPVLYEVSELSVRPHDLVLGALVIGLTIQAGAGRGSLAAGDALRRAMAPLLCFLWYVGLSLFGVYSAFPDRWALATASFLRLAQWAAIVPLTYLALAGIREVHLFVRAFAVLTLASIGLGLAQAWDGPGLFSERVRVMALLGPNELGLASGLLCLLGVVRARERRRFWPWGLGAAGGFGLLLTKSMSSTLATVVVVALYFLVRRRPSPTAVLRWGVAIVVGSILVVVAASMLRPSDAAALFTLRGGGSFAHRVVVGAGGIGMFLDRPVFGAGWQASAFPELTGDPRLARWLRELYPGVDEKLFPDRLPTQVHNLYIQMAAELGVVGILLFLWLVAALIVTTRAVVGRLEPGTPAKEVGRFLGLGLVFIAVWWNTNPLYGGQIESFLFFSFLGALLALERTAVRSAPAPLGPGG